MSSTSVPLHSDAAVLAFLLGTWVGEGHGHYPTVESFRYREEVRFWHAGKPWLGYSQRTWAPEDGRPLHTETGYWRPMPEGRVEVVLAQPSGHVEVQEGTIRGTEVTLASTLVGATATAKEVTVVSRRLAVGQATGVLSYVVAMAAMGEPLQEHLVARLTRAGEG